jgi:dTDP-4-dehydrorhamnose 3,5-epimerase-like enzyme
LSPDVWVPGAAEPSLDDFVEKVHRQIERYTTTHTAEETHVEVELGGGERLTLVSLSGEPGFGFLTLSETATVVYLCSEPYNPGHEHGINPLDPALGIDWPIPVDPADPAQLSAKDAGQPTLAEALAALRG